MAFEGAWVGQHRPTSPTSPCYLLPHFSVLPPLNCRLGGNGGRQTFGLDGFLALPSYLRLVHAAFLCVLGGLCGLYYFATESTEFTEKFVLHLRNSGEFRYRKTKLPWKTRSASKVAFAKKWLCSDRWADLLKIVKSTNHFLGHFAVKLICLTHDRKVNGVYRWQL